MLINDLPLIMLRCLVLTIIIEVIVGLILKINNKKDIINIILVNFITNPIVVSIPVYINIKFGLLERNICLIILELLTLFIEGFIYKKVFNYKKINPYLISLILNISSYLIGEIINYL